MNRQHSLLGMALGLLVLAGALLWLPGGQAAAAPDAAVLTVCPAGPPACQYGTIQAAVDAAAAGSTIKVAAGTYTDMHTHAAPPGYRGWPAPRQIVYLDKSVTIRGGYTPAFAEPPDPAANVTTLDAAGAGRVLFIAGSVAPAIEGLRLIRGNAAGLGGHLWGADSGGGVYVVTATATIADCSVLSSTAQYGGGLYLLRQHSTLDGNTIAGNHATQWGGGLLLFWQGSTLLQNTVERNTASSGGGLYLWNSSSTLDGNVIAGNIASAGAGVFLSSGRDRLAGNTIRDNDTQGHGGGGDGGGIYLEYSQATLTGNVIQANRGWGGGGLFLEESPAIVNGNTIISNIGRGGGGVYLEAGDALVEWNVIRENVAELSGGGLAMDSSAATVRGNLVADNLAGEGGGLYLSDSPALVTGNTISGNELCVSCMGWGAGLSAWNSDATISFNRITGNTGYWTGGGVSLYQSDAALDGNTFISNTARYGGGLYVEHSSPTAVNSLFVENRAEDAGSALQTSGSGVTRVLHGTFAGNTGGDGSGIYAGATTWLTNTIIVGHAVGVYVESGNAARLAATLWGSGAWANGADTAGPGAIDTGAINIWDVPGFADPAAGDYHLVPGSAALDQGLAAGVRDDIDRQIRPYQAPDLGADEYWPPGVLKRVYLPAILRQAR